MKPINHSDYTLAALRVFCQWRGVEGLHDDYGFLLARASEAEDHGVSFGAGFQRPLNWHFYNNGGHIKDNPLIPGKRTSEKRINDLITELKELLGKHTESPGGKYARKIMDIGGRLVHHVQDMSTPSHVVPVYHGPGLTDQYEVFGADFAGKIETVFMATPSNPQQANRLLNPITPNDIAAIKELVSNNPGHFLNNLHVFSATKTLSCLGDHQFQVYKNGQEETKNWNSFWQEKSVKDEQEFGSFGVLGNNFGRPFFDVAGTWYEVDHSQYLKLYSDMYRKSVIETVLVLDYIEENSKVFTAEPHKAIRIQGADWDD